MAKQAKQVPVPLTCDKCETKVISTQGSRGKKHQACGGRKKGCGKSRKDCGTWR